MRRENLILIADGGSTKTSWCLKCKSGVLKIFTTSGINPSVQSVDEIEKVFVEQLLMHIPNVRNVSGIFFYGAGCTPEKKEIVKCCLLEVVRDNIFLSTLLSFSVNSFSISSGTKFINTGT